MLVRGNTPNCIVRVDRIPVFSPSKNGELVLKANKGVRNGVYIYNGILTNKMLGEHLGISYKDIDLLMAAW